MPRYLFHVVCPGCEKTSEVISTKRTPGPTVSCGDCLMDKIEVVHMKVVKVEEVQ